MFMAKQIKPSVLRDSAVEELEEKLGELKSELAKERAMTASGTRPEKPANIKTLRRSIARILTIINEKKRGVKKGK